MMMMAATSTATHVMPVSKCSTDTIAEGLEVYSDIVLLRDELLNLCACIAARFSSGKISEMAVANLLMESLCDRFIIEKIKTESDSVKETDRIWRNLHDYAVSLLIERLKNELLAHGFSVALFNEVESPTGRYDVLVAKNNGQVHILNEKGSISLEVKTGLNVSLNQLERYLWNGTTVILLRVGVGDIVALRPNEWACLLKSALIDRIKKAKRILAGAWVLVPSGDCRKCPLKSCHFNRNQNGIRDMTRPRDLSELLNRFRMNVYRAIEVAVEAVLKELKGCTQNMVPMSGCKEPEQVNSSEVQGVERLGQAC